AVTLKPEVTGLDHTGVDRADRDLVNLVALDPVELGDADPGPRLPGRRAGDGRLEPDRLEPRMADRHHARLLPDLALEQVDLGADRRDRRKRFSELGRRELQ